MGKPILVVMAAGLGSRYGGLKQIDPVGQNGEIIVDYSVYDAIQAGFDKVIFIIKKEAEKDFKDIVGNKYEGKIKVEYAFQDIKDVPAGYEIPQGREKPWGTGHAVLAARDLIDGPFAAINADDYYGREAFTKIYKFLLETENTDKQHFAMVGYNIMNTLSDHGHVARGVCVTDSTNKLVEIIERTKIEKHDGEAEFTLDDTTWTKLPKDSTVSMNMWGFSQSMVAELQNHFENFFKTDVPQNPLKSEYFLPFVVNDLLEEGKADVKVLTSADKWFGVTYKEDKPIVMEALKKLGETGVYPVPLLG